MLKLRTLLTIAPLLALPNMAVAQHNQHRRRAPEMGFSGILAAGLVTILGYQYLRHRSSLSEQS